MVSIEQKVGQRITSKKRGTIFFAQDFSDLGTPEGIRQALVRLVAKATIRRVAQGIYVRPEYQEHIGEVMPSAEDVAHSIAKRDHIRIIPTGVYALNLLGLSSQVPLKLVYLTDGAPREIQIGKRTIKLKRATPKNFLAKGKISGLVIQGLREIGQDRLTEEVEIKIISMLRSENQVHLKHDMLLAPVWIRKIMQKAQC